MSRIVSSDESDPSARQEENTDSVAELFYENSKQRRYDLAFGARIGAINSNPEVQRIVSRAFKRYPGAATVALPEIRPGEGPSFEQVVVDRRSTHSFTGEPLTSIEIAKLLYFANGITGRIGKLDGSTAQLLRAAPSGGALYPVEIYAGVFEADGVPAGLYHYAVAEHVLERVRSGSPAAALGAASSYEAVFAQASIALILTIIGGRSRFKYGERGYRFALLEAGHIAQNVLLAATALQLGAVPVGGFVDDEMNAILDVDGVDEAAIYLVVAGHPTRRPASDDQMMVAGLLQSLWQEELKADASGSDAAAGRTGEDS